MNSLVVVIDAFPPSVNNIYYATRWGRALKKEQKNFRKLVCSQLYGQKIPSDWKFVDVDVILTPPNYIKRDVDNYTKAIFDAFTNAGFWSDDSIVSSVSSQFTIPNKKEPKSIVVLSNAKDKYRSLDECLYNVGINPRKLDNVKPGVKSFDSR